MASILLLAQLIALISVAACDTQIKQVQRDEAQLIETSALNYGITAPSLSQNNMKAVSVNNDDVVIYGIDCQPTLKKLGALTESERNLLQSARNQMDYSNGMSINGQNGHFSISTNSLSPGQSYSMNFRSFEGNSFSSTNYYQQGGSSSAGSAALPDNLARVYIGKDVVTFVYLDGKVQMKPTACLQPAEHQLVQQLKVEYEAAEKRFKEDMAKFQQNMHNSMQNLQQNMANMRNNMMNSFNWMNPQQQYQQQSQNYQQQQQQYPQQQQQYPQQQQQYQQPQQQTFNPSDQQNLIPTSLTDNVPQQSNFFNGASLNNLQGGFQNAPTPFVPNSSPFGNNFPLGPNNSPFGNNFPFGPNNSPFGNNFPFGPNNSPFGNNFPFGPNNSPFGNGFPFGQNIQIS